MSDQSETKGTSAPEIVYISEEMADIGRIVKAGKPYVKYIRADCVDGSKLGIMERNFKSGHQEGLLDATKHIKAIYEKYVQPYEESDSYMIELAKTRADQLLYVFSEFIEAIQADLKNAGGGINEQKSNS